MEIIIVILISLVLIILYSIQNRLKEIDESINDFNGDWLRKNHPDILKDEE